MPKGIYKRDKEFLEKLKIQGLQLAKWAKEHPEKNKERAKAAAKWWKEHPERAKQRGKTCWRIHHFSHEHMAEIGKKGAEATRKKHPGLSKLTAKKMHQKYSFVGPKNPNWRGGSPINRGKDWGKNKLKCLKRDKYICQRCGYNGQNNKSFMHVHHIIPYRISNSNKLKNLIVLCKNCHHKRENEGQQYFKFRVGYEEEKEKEVKMYYKVMYTFPTLEGKLVSSTVEGKAMVEYKPRKYVKAPEWLSKKGYNLLVFDNLEKAINFANNSSARTEMNVWKCKIKGKKKKLPVFKSPDVLGLGKLSECNWMDWPDGTVMAKEVKITEPVLGCKERRKEERK